MVKNPEANARLECLHKVLDNVLHTTSLEDSKDHDHSDIIDVI